MCTISWIGPNICFCPMSSICPRLRPRKPASSAPWWKAPSTWCERPGDSGPAADPADAVSEGRSRASGGSPSRESARRSVPRFGRRSKGRCRKPGTGNTPFAGSSSQRGREVLRANASRRSALDRHRTPLQSARRTIEPPTGKASGQTGNQGAADGLSGGRWRRI